MSLKEIPRITFGIIVLNGEPFTKYCLQHLYPYAHEIIVVEGGSKNAIEYAPNGHSTDGTLEALYEFKANKDPENKVQIITKTGFWEEKDKQSHAYAARATGDWLWQVDIDEFYTKRNLERIIKLLQTQSNITGMSFKTFTFWGNLNTIADGWSLKRGREIFHRLFKWGQGYSYVTHRPPTVCNENGENLRNIKYLDGKLLYKDYGIYMNHYSLLLPRQVVEKATYYTKGGFRTETTKWTQNNYLRLGNVFRVHNVYEYPSWLERYKGEHNEQTVKMFEEISKNKEEELRNMDDVDRLLGSWKYLILRTLVEKAEIIDRIINIYLKQRLSLIMLLIKRMITK
ncbi:MAG: glycosyltransferase family 2 protein [Planctomycetes bacterium]|nr:glycosyltransferase family 2 protein [Planctomycetota bacterium]